MREAKIDERVFAEQRGFGEGLAIMRQQGEGSTDLRGAGAFGEGGNTEPFESEFLVPEVQEKTTAGAEE